MSRPKKASTKTRVVYVRVDELTHSRWLATAKKCNIPLAEYVRHCVDLARARGER